MEYNPVIIGSALAITLIFFFLGKLYERNKPKNTLPGMQESLPDPDVENGFSMPNEVAPNLWNFGSISPDSFEQNLAEFLIRRSDLKVISVGSTGETDSEYASIYVVTTNMATA